MVAAYKTSFDLSEFDTANVEFLQKHTGMTATNIVHAALSFAKTSLEHHKAGRYTTVKCSWGCTDTLSHGGVAQAFNNRSPAAQPITVTMYRTADALQDIHDIKAMIGAKTDGAAVGYALALSVEMVQKLKGADKGKAARIFYTASNHPNKVGYTYTEPHPFEVSKGNTFRRNKRVIGKALAKLSPWHVKGDLPFTADPAASNPAPEQNNTPQEEPPKPEIDTGVITDGTDSEIKAMKPMTFKPKGGLNL
ncbi:MAG: hypothetical protein ACAH80_02900 [Alphaproteobacteria bacterium]